MPNYTEFAAVVFDVDDTLLQNHPASLPTGLHERSRLKAMHTVGARRGIPALVAATSEDASQAFRNAPVHSLEGALWQSLRVAGVVNGDVIEQDHPLLLELVKLKNDMHEEVLRQYGEEMPGATDFVRLLASRRFAGKMAIASTGVRRDILLALDIIGVREFFPDERIITKEQFFEHPKPHPRAFELAYASLDLPEGTTPAQVLAFEDDPRGVMSAKAAGLFTCGIAIRHPKELLTSQPVAPDLVAENYAEMATLLGLQ